MPTKSCSAYRVRRKGRNFHKYFFGFSYSYIWLYHLQKASFKILDGIIDFNIFKHSSIIMQAFHTAAKRYIISFFVRAITCLHY